MNKILVICGPTATGKTALALHLAQIFAGELVSADSRQIYQSMDIGTGKDIPANAQKKQVPGFLRSDQTSCQLPVYSVMGIPLWMYDVVTPSQEFSVHEYANLARQVIENIQSRGKLPIIVGGTGLYIQSLLKPLTTQVAPDKLLRLRLESQSLEQLQNTYSQLKENDFNQLNNSEKNNKRRLIRKIEIALSDTPSEPVSDTHGYEACIIALRMSRDSLYKKINSRVEERYQKGIKTEIQKLLSQGINWDMHAMSALGYKQWRSNFENNQSDEETIQQWKYAEHDYARRQETWFSKATSVHWLEGDSDMLIDDSIQLVRPWYNNV